MKRKKSSAYDTIDIAHLCQACDEYYVAPRSRNSKLCHACQQKYNAAQAKKQPNQQTTLNRATRTLEDMVRDETRMPWERKYTRSIWSR